MSATYPNYDDIVRESHEIAERSRDLVTFSEIGKSEEGRALPLLTITDPVVPRSQKSVLLLSGGTDGDEEVGRAVSLGMARALLKPENRVHLRRQVVLVVPVTNPDGCERDQPDRLGNAKGIEATQVHVTDIPATAEGRAMRALVDEWIPDAHVDFHGLAGGGMGDCSYLYPTLNRNWSVPILTEVALKLEQAGAEAGYPQEGRPRVWWEKRTNLPGWLAWNQGTFCMVMEGTENYYPIEDSVRSGVARLLRLMEIGESLGYFQDFPNYPCDVVSGGRMAAIMPLGKDYAERRHCRRHIARMIVEGVPWFGRVPCDHDWVARIRFPVEDSVKTFPSGMVFKATLDSRATIREVSWQERKMENSQWTVTRDLGGQVIRAEVPEPPRRGENTLSIRYEVPFRRHVTLRRA